MNLELYLKKRTEERALMSSLEDAGEAVRVEAGAEGSQGYILWSIPQLKSQTAEVCYMREGGGPWEELSLYLQVKVFTSKKTAARQDLNVTFSSHPGYPFKTTAALHL